MEANHFRAYPFLIYFGTLFICCTGLLMGQSSFPTRTLTISQSEGLPTLIVRADSIRLTSSQGSNGNIWITSNSEVIVECSHPWVKASVFTRGRFSSIVVTAEENQAFIERKASLTVRVKGLPAKEIAVVQSASSPPK